MGEERQNTQAPGRCAKSTPEQKVSRCCRIRKQGMLDNQSVTGTQYKTSCLRPMNIKTVTSPTSYHPP